MPLAWARTPTRSCSSWGWPSGSLQLVLLAPGAPGTAGRAEQPGRPGRGGSHFGPVRTGVRPGRHDRYGRHAGVGHGHFRRPGARRHARRPSGDAGVGERAAGRAVLARGPGRAGPGAGPATSGAPAGERRCTRPGRFDRLAGGPCTGPAGLSVVGAGLFVLVLAAPALGMHTESLDLAQLLPYSSPQAVTARQVAAEFPGTPSPAAVVVKAPRISAADMRAQLASLGAGGTGLGALRPPVQLLVYPRANVEILRRRWPATGLGRSRSTPSAPADLVPRTVGLLPGPRLMSPGTWPKASTTTPPYTGPPSRPSCLSWSPPS